MNKNDIVHVVTCYNKKQLSKYFIFSEFIDAEKYATNYNKNTDLEHIAIVTSVAVW